MSAKNAKVPNQNPAADASKPAESDAKAGGDGFDFSALAVQDASQDALPAIQRKREQKPNPLELPVKDSYEHDKVKQVNVPEAQVKHAVNLIRRAANKMKIGVRVVTNDPVDGHVLIVFKAKERAKRKSKDESTEAPAETSPSETAVAV